LRRPIRLGFGSLKIDFPHRTLEAWAEDIFRRLSSLRPVFPERRWFVGRVRG
jgi:hypothetical protein